MSRVLRSVFAFTLVACSCGPSAESGGPPPAGSWDFDGARSYVANEAKMLAGMVDATSEERLKAAAAISATFAVMRIELDLKADGTFTATTDAEGGVKPVASIRGTWTADGAELTLRSASGEGVEQMHVGTWTPEELTIDWVTEGDSRRMIFARGR